MTAFAAADFPDSKIRPDGTWNVSHRGNIILVGASLEPPLGQAHYLMMRVILVASRAVPGPFVIRPKITNPLVLDGSVFNMHTVGGQFRIDQTFEFLCPAGATSPYSLIWLSEPGGTVVVTSRSELIGFRHQ